MTDWSTHLELDWGSRMLKRLPGMDGNFSRDEEERAYSANWMEDMFFGYDGDDELHFPFEDGDDDLSDVEFSMLDDVSPWTLEEMMGGSDDYFVAPVILIEGRRFDEQGDLIHRGRTPSRKVGRAMNLLHQMSADKVVHATRTTGRKRPVRVYKNDRDLRKREFKALRHVPATSYKAIVQRHFGKKAEPMRLAA